MEKSNAEIELMDFYKQLVGYNFISVSDFKLFEDRLNKLLLKVEELHKSREKWRAKYEKENKRRIAMELK